MIKNLLNKLTGRNNKKGANDELLAMIQKQNEIIANLQSQLNNTVKAETCVTKVPTEPVVNTNTEVKLNDHDTVQADNYESTINRNEFHKERTFTQEFDNVDWKELQRSNPEYIQVMLDEVREKIMTSLNPNFYAEVLSNYRTELLQQYLMRLLIVNGTYQAEYDNLDSLTRDEISAQIIDIEIDNWVARQIKKGKEPKASLKQLELLQKNGVDTSNIKYWFQASAKLEEIFGSYDNTATDRQKELIAKLVTELGLQGYDMSVSTKTEASKKIEELQKLHEEKFGAKKPTKAQYELYARYLKLNNKRLTQSAKDKMMSMNAREISDAINELRTQYNTNHPECSEGQVNYIVSLHEQLMIGYDIQIIRELTRVQATEKIDELSRILLFRKMKRTMSTITMEDIKKLSRDEVKVKLEEFRPQR